ncbi:hypothetical protein FB451DRAFT_1402746 [Mycena latifolia]|nr:hypothetical protein FB451DRAFT_1402746 [Mycena latifolia]
MLPLFLLSAFAAIAAPTSALVAPSVGPTAIVASTGLGSSPAAAASTSALVAHNIDLTARTSPQFRVVPRSTSPAFVLVVASTGIERSPAVAATTSVLVPHSIDLTALVASTGLGSSPAAAASTSALVAHNIDLTARTSPQFRVVPRSTSPAFVLVVASTGIESSPAVAATTSVLVPHSIDLTALIASTGLGSSPASTSALVAHNIGLIDVVASTGIGSSPVVSATTRGFVPEPSNTTGALSVWDQSSASPHPTTFPVPVVEHKGSGDSPSPPTNVLISELSNTTAEESTTPDTVPVYVFMDNGSGLPVSPKIIFGIIFAFILFVALNIALFCLWNKRFCRSRSPNVPPSRCPHVAMTVSCALTCPRPANPRPLSCETMVGRASDAKDDDSVKHSGAEARESLELVPVTRPAHAWTRGRPRAPLVENAF